ncbi:uncharacterized protein RAG0_03028 [Rhynchosporium agropyri]|uniref:Uncharacterized protein n=1 Tax=Rhynchosporium agropyri TaxID=914238 RepID=A0A1E1K331_9HELO|nr:uncharacterized protein RAG0_03028 [Rhynchosporium agropyri]
MLDQKCYGILLLDGHESYICYALLYFSYTKTFTTSGNVWNTNPSDALPSSTICNSESSTSTMRSSGLISIMALGLNALTAALSGPDIRGALGNRVCNGNSGSSMGGRCKGSQNLGGILPFNASVIGLNLSLHK